MAARSTWTSWGRGTLCARKACRPSGSASSACRSDPPTSFLAGGQEPKVAAVWADSAYTDTQLALGLFLKDQEGLPDIFVPGAILWARVVAGDDLTKFNPIDEVDHDGGRSITFVHGRDDAALPASMAGELHDRAVAAGATSPDAWLVAGAGHTKGVHVVPAEYETRLVRFFDGAIGGGPRSGSGGGSWTPDVARVRHSVSPGP